jgi:hypothetical protein
MSFPVFRYMCNREIVNKPRTRSQDKYFTSCAFFCALSRIWTASDPEVRVRFPSLQEFLKSSGSGTGSTQPREDN